MRNGRSVRILTWDDLMKFVKRKARTKTNDKIAATIKGRDKKIRIEGSDDEIDLSEDELKHDNLRKREKKIKGKQNKKKIIKTQKIQRTNHNKQFKKKKSYKIAEKNDGGRTTSRIPQPRTTRRFRTLRIFDSETAKRMQSDVSFVNIRYKKTKVNDETSASKVIFAKLFLE